MLLDLLLGLLTLLIFPMFLFFWVVSVNAFPFHKGYEDWKHLILPTVISVVYTVALITTFV